MHIAIVCRHLASARGGHERYLKRLVKGLIGKGFRITVFSGDFDPDAAHTAGLECVRVPCQRFPQWLRYISFNRNARAATAKRAGEFDLVFSTEYVTFGNVYRAGAGITRAEIDACGRLRDRISLKNRVKMRIQTVLMEKAAPHVIVNSESMRSQIRRYYRIAEDRVSLVYNGIDTNTFSTKHTKTLRAETRGELGLNEDDFVCITVGANWRRKGIDRVLKMMSYSTGKRLKLLVVGSAGSGLKRMCGPSEDRVTFRGPSDDIRRFYAAADLCIVASRYDPAPNVILESLACGLPVAVGSECGLTELIEGTGCGTVFCGTDGLAGAVEDIMRMKDSNRYHRMCLEAARLGGGFTMERHLRRIIEILETYSA